MSNFDFDRFLAQVPAMPASEEPAPPRDPKRIPGVRHLLFVAATVALVVGAVTGYQVLAAGPAPAQAACARLAAVLDWGDAQVTLDAARKIVPAGSPLEDDMRAYCEHDLDYLDALPAKLARMEGASVCCEPANTRSAAVGAGTGESPFSGPSDYVPSAEQKAMFLLALDHLDDAFALESDQDLLDLGAEVCESLRNGASREDVMTILYNLHGGWSGPTSAAFVVATDSELC